MAGPRTDGDASLGRRLRAIRQASGWTLKQMSQRIELPLSTLSKVERDELTLGYQQLRRIMARLGLAAAELFGNLPPTVTASGWRSIERQETLAYQAVGACEYAYPCAELRQRRMFPVLVRMHGAGVRTAGSLVRGPGEQYLYVLTGAVEVITALYSAVVLGAGDSMYLDARMEHAYGVARGCTEASALLMCSEPPPPAHGPPSVTPDPEWELPTPGRQRRLG